MTGPFWFSVTFCVAVVPAGGFAPTTSSRTLLPELAEPFPVTCLKVVVGHLEIRRAQVPVLGGACVLGITHTTSP